MSDKDTNVTQETPLSYRDLIQRKADGEQVSDYKLELWRREEELIRAAISYPQAYKACGIREGHFEAWLHRMAWKAYQQLIDDVPTIESIQPTALVSTIHRLDDQGVIQLRRGQLWVDALISEAPIPPDLGLRTVVKELQQHQRLKMWRSKVTFLTGRVEKDIDLPALQADFARQGLEMSLEAQKDAVRHVPVTELPWDPATSAIVSVVRTGIQQIDDAAGGGIGRGELCAIGGGTNHGKSYVGLDLCRRQAMMGKRALYITTEDPTELAFCRLLSTFCEPRCTPVSIRTRRADPAIIQAAQQRMKEALGDRLYIEECKKPDVSKVCDTIMLYRWAYDVDLVVVDYAQAITNAEFPSNKVQEASSIVSWLKRTATDCGVALALLSQYARESYRDTEPGLNAFKYTGDMENEAELVLLLWKDAAGTLHVKVPKVKWAKADELRYIIPTDPVNGWPGEWEDDFGGPEVDDE